MKDSDRPTKVTEAFDFSKPYVEPWEVAKIRYAVEEYEVYPSPHAEKAMLDDDIDIDDCYHVLKYGKAKDKDLPYNERGRPQGINFEGNISDGRRFLVKVGWWRGYYEIATTYELK